MKTFISCILVLADLSLAMQSFGVSKTIPDNYSIVNSNSLNDFKSDLANNDDEHINDSSNDQSWQPIGIDIYGNTSQWIKPGSYKSLNKDSFRMKFKWEENQKPLVGRIDVNCLNKDYYIRKKKKMHQGRIWKSISKGSSIHELAMIYCKKTSAASSWGYTLKTKYLWNILKPTTSASNLKGKWITVYDNKFGEFQYNSNIEFKDDYVLAAYHSRKNPYRVNSKYSSSRSKYGWIAVSCISNLHSIFLDLDSSISGQWMPPKAGRPGGGAQAIRKEACRT